MDNRLARNDLRKFYNILGGNGFLVYGTALGAIRENNIIGHDLDIDIGIMAENFDLKMINDLILSGFNLIRVFGMLHCGFELSFKSVNGIKIDLMFFYKEGNKIWNSLWDNGGVNGLSDMIVHSYPTTMFKNNNCYIDNLNYKCLDIDYIEHVYGKDWKTAKKEWNWRTDHLCHDKELKKELINKYGKR